MREIDWTVFFLEVFRAVTVVGLLGVLVFVVSLAGRK